ncbi:hypothetical protein [Bombiscardovia coagulans]|uniref:Uncharacterized protein n=1 Tax=Bombiscardovia coagulans TaxID=686666 RepID=A0A261EU64_9BIFI|nr:hypothetical protein [Bombiscardovia coagulans]OZG50400.1 hypothetical protein BOCO_0917 [Bombiscardovia coagulans]
MDASDVKIDFSVPLTVSDFEQGEANARREGTTLTELVQTFVHNLADEDDADDDIVLHTPAETRAFFDRIVQEETGRVRTQGL